MSKSPYRQDKDEMRELLRQFENLKNGRSHSFLEEESFERLINHFDEKEDMPQALQAAELGIEIYPYSGMLLVKKADLLIATRQYTEAMHALEKAELLDSNDINLFILKTDVFWPLINRKKQLSFCRKRWNCLQGKNVLNCCLNWQMYTMIMSNLTRFLNA